MFTDQHNEIKAIADLALASSADQLLVPQRDHVDVLLDLLVVADDPIVRSTITDRLRDIRFVTMIEADEVRADLDAIVTISALEHDDDMAWAELAFVCQCADCVAALPVS
jgi:hypothetical protein